MSMDFVRLETKNNFIFKFSWLITFVIYKI